VRERGRQERDRGRIEGRIRGREGSGGLLPHLAPIYSGMSSQFLGIETAKQDRQLVYHYSHPSQTAKSI